MDFSQLPLPQPASAPTDPFKIFAGLPRLPGAPNDLWRGQAEALAHWDQDRTKSDILLSLNTGAGKTIVGLIIAKSLVNEGLQNVIYVCPTNDLVRQTAAQAAMIGIDVTTRTGANFNNDLFESGRTFCITNYATVFNGLSAIRRRFFPSAIIFDDAHVAESTMRDAFTLSVERKDHQSLFEEVAALYRPHFRQLGREQQFAKALDQATPMPDSVLVPPEVVRATSAQLSALMIGAGTPNDQNLKYPYEHLKDHLDRCAVIFRSGKFDVTPPFLPSLALDVFEQRVRRIYLSATLHNKADIIRAFGRAPDVVIEPANDAGNGERLIVMERELGSQNFDAIFARRLANNHKVLVAISGYHKALDWKILAEPAPKEEFTDRLEAFRRAPRGAFILVSRVDGIDLPNDTCRLMVIDGVPRGESLLEKYQFEYLHMHNFAASRIANRLVQLFGRINRGRSDYGAFLIAGHDLNVWLNNDRHIALLPQLLKNQILLGRSVQKGMSIRDLDKVENLLGTVLLSEPRDAGWLDYYSKFLDANDIPSAKTEAALKAEARNLEAAKAEALYAKHVWQNDFTSAREALDVGVADLARSDEKLAGWHNLWIGACLHYEGKADDAWYYYSRARGQLGGNLILDSGPIGGTDPLSASRHSRFVGKLNVLLSLTRESFEKQMSLVERELSYLSGATPNQMEEATRRLGEFLGFDASRPDNEFDTGPDVMWIDPEDNSGLGLELKTDKGEGVAYSKDDVSQSLDHAEWMKERITGTFLGVVIVGPNAGVLPQANPSPELYSIPPVALVAYRDRILAIVRDAYSQPATDRLAWLTRTLGDDWSLRSMSRTLCGNPLKT